MKSLNENKCADVFCQINKMQKMFLKNHKKIENGFRDLLLQCFEDKEEANLDSNQKDKENKNDEGYLYKTQSNKKNPDIMNCVNMENEYYSKSNMQKISKFNIYSFFLKLIKQNIEVFLVFLTVFKLNFK